WAAFGTKQKHTANGVQTVPPTPAQRSFGKIGLLPAAVLAAAGVLAALFPAWTGSLPYAYGETFHLLADEHLEPLSLWHGFNLVLGLSILILVAGLALFAART